MITNLKGDLAVETTSQTIQGIQGGHSISPVRAKSVRSVICQCHQYHISATSASK